MSRNRHRNRRKPHNTARFLPQRELIRQLAERAPVLTDDELTDALAELSAPLRAKLTRVEATGLPVRTAIVTLAAAMARKG